VNVSARCERCGATVTLNLPAGLADLALVGVICQPCVEDGTEERGGVLDLALLPEGALFTPGRTTITPGAIEALEDAGQHAAEFLARHLSGDWGNCGRASEIQLTDAEARAGSLGTSDDGKLNAIA